MTWKDHDFKWGPEQQDFQEIEQEGDHATALVSVMTAQDVKNVFCITEGENGPFWSLWQNLPGEAQG